MAWHARFQYTIDQLNVKVDQDQIEGPSNALEIFSQYLDAIQEIGEYSLINWNIGWRDSVYQFGVKFKNKNPMKFISLIKEKIAIVGSNKEVLNFFLSELYFNSTLPRYERKSHIEELIRDFPNNPEFRQTYVSYLLPNEEFDKSFEQIKYALAIEPANNNYITTKFTIENAYLNYLIRKEEYQKAKDFVDPIVDEKYYGLDYFVFGNALIGFQSRIEDRATLVEKMKTLEQSIIDKARKEVEGERIKIVEIIGVFSAIIAFVLATVSIGKNFDFSEAIYFLVGLGLILILFTVSLSAMFSPSKEKSWKDWKFLVLILGLIGLLGYVLVVSRIV
jgi:tetratricopeptide (TPR) repeat protein